MNIDKRDIGSQLKAAVGAGARGVAAGTGDNTEFNTGYVSRKGYSSCVVVISGSAVLTQDKILSIIGNLQDATSSGGAGVADFGTALTATTVATGGAGGSTESFIHMLKFDLSAADEFIRFQCTPDLDASGTDTFHIATAILLGGADETPAA